MYAKIETQSVVEYPLSEHEIKQRFPNTSFATDFANCLPYGYVQVKPSSQPSVDETKVIFEVTPLYVDGNWQQSWGVKEKYSSEELAQLEKEKTDRKWSDLRDERNSKLYESDWTQLPDSNVDKQSWAEYRQKLRDLPETVTDINNVTWPVEP